TVYNINHLFVLFFFFFQAEDGIRDFHVTGVQTCALPIYPKKTLTRRNTGYALDFLADKEKPFNLCDLLAGSEGTIGIVTEAKLRSEERRVGKEWRSRW